jgi:peptidyl-prolyl cis-trans isomerase NIMA-interacting 1
LERHAVDEKRTVSDTSAMCPLDLFRVGNSSRTYAVILVCTWLASGCCQAGSDATAASSGAPTPSAPLAPLAPPANSSSASGTATAAVADSSQAIPDAPPGPPPREIAGASHILVAFKGAENAPKTITRSKDDARKRAEQALKELQKDESKFAELVKKYSDDAVSKPAEGRLGNFERNAMPKAFSDACFSMMIDTISGVVETPRGFHIIKRTK